MLVQVISAFGNRSNNETFWKVLSTQVTQLADKLEFDEFVEVLDVLDYSSSDTLFNIFVKKFFLNE